MLKGMQAVAGGLAVAALAGVVWAATAPSVEVAAPTSAKVGSTFLVHAHASTGVDPTMPSEGPLFLVVTVTHMPRAGNGNGRRTTTIVDVENTHELDIDTPVTAYGWSSGCEIRADATAHTAEGAFTTTTTRFVPFTNGNGGSH